MMLLSSHQRLKLEFTENMPEKIMDMFWDKYLGSNINEIYKDYQLVHSI